MTLEQLREIVSNIVLPFPKSEIRLMPKGDGLLLQIVYWEDDVDFPTQEVEQHGRKWYVSLHSTESEVVRTVLLACLVSAEHQVRERFYYKGKRIFGPHIDVNHMVQFARDCPLAREDHREEKK